MAQLNRGRRGFMFIEELYIENYKVFKGGFTLPLQQGVNIVVGDNEAGKSTILEAVNLVLTGMIGNRYLRNNLNQYLFNNEVVDQFLKDLDLGNRPELPRFTIELYFASVTDANLEGNLNHKKTKAEGVSISVEFDEGYRRSYETLIGSGEKLTTIPMEYYTVVWKGFGREPVVSRSIPIKSVLIDSTSTRYQNGSDVYISRIIQDDLDDLEKVGLSQAYRRLKQGFLNDDSVKSINKKITAKTEVTKKDLSVSVDLESQNSWETSLMTFLEDVPFHQIGKGEQCIIKTCLALEHKKSKEANVVLLEEPENHLSHSKLNQLIKLISEKCESRQLIISTHSSYVSNKLGLEHLSLLHGGKVSKLLALQKDTYKFFKKLPGYQTLRVVLCSKAVLVEGDSDELVFQRAYMDSHDGKLPIEDGIDVISVGLSFKRFLELAEKLDRNVCVITDNDGDFDNKITKKYKDYMKSECIKIFADNDEALNTLEPQFVNANKDNLKSLIKVLGLKEEKYKDDKSVSDYMEKNKTKWALKIFEADDKLMYPKYISDAVAWCDG
ncbi:MAG: putative ATP-dependent endonuclease of OLD family [Oleiphilaceae bacterium]|jgi:putative ATP-dependent endonuclease of OLD family